MHGSGEPHHLVLEHVIPRAGLDRLDGPVLLHRPGKQNERGVGHSLLRQSQRLKPVERLQRKVRQDQVEVPELEFASIGEACLDPGDLARRPLGGDELAHQRGVKVVVLQMQDPNGPRIAWGHDPGGPWPRRGFFGQKLGFGAVHRSPKEILAVLPYIMIQAQDWTVRDLDYDKIEKWLIDYPNINLRYFLGRFLFIQNGRVQSYVAYGIGFVVFILLLTILNIVI